jgi:Ala-tRNA(Pro) deacylase
MPTKRLLDFLNRENVKYVVLNHSPAYTAQEIAASAHVHGKELAKTVMVSVDGKMAMAVTPATRKINFDLLKVAAGTENVELACEKAFRDMFPQCEVGAMPPFGNLYDMPVFASLLLAADPEIVFNAGTHTELVRMSYADFERLAHPKVARIAYGE